MGLRMLISLCMQTGQIFESHGAWFLRFYEGSKRVTKRLASVDEYPSKLSVKPLAQEVIRSVNRSPDASITLDEFIETRYLPYTKELRESTYNGYKNLWNANIQGWPEAQHRLREYRTVHCQKLLDAIANKKKLTSSTLQHIKHFLSGAFRYAAQAGIREGNPVTECSIPKKHTEANETYAYNLDEIRKTLAVLPLLQKAAVACAAFAGLRLAELHGLEWTDYDGEDLNIHRSMWRGHVNPTKSKASKNYIPVIRPLKEILDEYRSFATPGAMFPVELEHIGNRHVKAAMEGIGLAWHGWHSFRRGIASNLFELGCDDITVQRVLRHSKVQITRAHYIKIRDPKLEAAMQSLSDAYGQQVGSKKSVTH